MSRSEPIRVLLAEDAPAVREALAALVDSEPGLVLVGMATNGAEAIELARLEQPDVALTDVRMPGGGPALVRAIRQVSPRTRILALSGADDRATVLEMLEAGVIGYLVKGVSIGGVVESIERAADGQGSLSVEVTGDVIQELADQLGRTRHVEDQRRELEQLVRTAISDDGAVSMVFQPICDLAGGEIVGVEALARFSGEPVRGPLEWFADASRAGLRSELELAALRKALVAQEQLAEELYMSVNLSPATLVGDGFRALVETFDPGRVVVELTEHAPISEYHELDDALGRLKRLGVRLAIDDAGAGFSSLRHILRLAPDFIKLDGTLIDGIEHDPSQQALTAGLVSFAGKIDSTIIAEGIEHENQLHALADLGVAFGQGFFLARPGPLPSAQSAWPAV